MCVYDVIDDIFLSFCEWERDKVKRSWVVNLNRCKAIKCWIISAVWVLEILKIVFLVNFSYHLKPQTEKSRNFFISGISSSKFISSDRTNYCGKPQHEFQMLLSLSWSSMNPNNSFLGIPERQQQWRNIGREAIVMHQTWNV